MEKISSLILPLVVVGILIFALTKKINIFEAFIEGAKAGVQTSFSILPALVALMVAIGVFKSSGAVDILAFALSPITSLINMPKEVIPLVLLRPISGSGAMAVTEGILKSVGADSFAGRVASVMQGSTETTFYTIAVYFSAVGISKTSYALPCALVGDFVGYIVSVLAVRLFFA